MKKLATLLLSATLLSGAVYADADKVMATYKGGEVKESDIMNKFKDALSAQPTYKDKKFTEFDKKLQDALVTGFVNTKLLELEAKSSNLETSKEYQEKLAQAKEQLLQQVIIEGYLKKSVTDSMIDAEYDKLAKDLVGKEEVKASNITVDTEEKAKEVKKKLSKGAKFADVLKEYSADEKGSGGTLGYFMEGKLPIPEIEKKAFSMKVGEISDPIKTEFGWNIIKVEDRRKVKVPSKEEARQAIVSRLNSIALEKYLEELMKKYDVKITD